LRLGLTVPAGGSKGRQAVLEIGVNRQVPVQPGNRQNLGHRRLDGAHGELAAGPSRLPLKLQEQAHSGAAQVLDAAQVQQQSGTAALLQQPHQLGANVADGCLVHDAPGEEAAHGHAADLVYFQEV
jgi:hypothetical protein